MNMNHSHSHRNVSRIALSAALFLIVSNTSALAESAYKTEWTRELSTTGTTCACGISADGQGNVYISGYTAGVLDTTNYGSLDAFVSKYDAQGKLLWTRQLGTTEEDQGRGVAADGLGNVYISGFTAGSLGGPNAGGFDAFVSKYDGQGTLLWTRQLGTSKADQSMGASADKLGNIYIAGSTNGSLDGVPSGDRLSAFVSKYNALGKLLWTRQPGAVGGCQATSVSADGIGNIYVSGLMSNSPGIDREVTAISAFVSKYDAQGNLLWTQQNRTADHEQCNGVSADRLGSVFTSGFEELKETLPNMTVIHRYASASKHDADGKLVWTKHLPTATRSESNSVSADGLGNVYIAGSSDDSLEGSAAGAFVSKFDAGGKLLWTRQFGTSSNDACHGVSADRLGNVYAAGWTLGPHGGPTVSGDGAFVTKLTPAGGPAIWVLAIGAAVLLVGGRFLIGRFF